MTRHLGALQAIAAMGFVTALAACSSSNSTGIDGTGGASGFGGQGGQGGVEPALVRMVHLATDVPRPERTEVNFFMIGSGSFDFIGFGIVTLYGVVPPGPLVVEARTLGRGDVLATASAEVESGRYYTFVAYRDEAQATEMNLAFFDEDVADASATQGRLWVGHGVDDASWDSVQVVLADGDPMPLATLGLGEQTPPIDLDAGPHEIGFDIAAPSPAIDVGPFTVELDPGNPSIVFAVDRDTTNLSVSPEVFAIGPNTSGAIDPLPAP